MPVGVPELAVTVAVKVTDWPKFDGLGDEVRMSRWSVSEEPTTWDSEALEFVKLPSVLA